MKRLVSQVEGGMREVSRSEARLPVLQREMNGLLSGPCADDVSVTQGHEQVIMVVAVHQSGSPWRNSHIENADILVLQNQMVTRFRSDVNGWWLLGHGAHSQQQQRRDPGFLHRKHCRNKRSPPASTKGRARALEGLVRRRVLKHDKVFFLLVLDHWATISRCGKKDGFVSLVGACASVDVSGLDVDIGLFPQLGEIGVCRRLQFLRVDGFLDLLLNFFQRRDSRAPLGVDLYNY